MKKQTKKLLSKNKKYKLNFSRIILIVCIIYCSLTMIKQQFQINEYNLKIKDVSSQIQIKEQETEILNDLKKKTTDPTYIEKIAREKLDLVKPYEKIFIDVNK